MGINPLSDNIFNIGCAEYASLLEDEKRDIDELIPVIVTKDCELHL
jgi:hypothetical protein